MFKKNSPELMMLILNVATALLIAVTMTINDNLGDVFVLYFGLSCLGIGLLDIPIAIVVFIAGSNAYGKAFLISAGLLLLLSGISCGSSVLFE